MQRDSSLRLRITLLLFTVLALLAVSCRQTGEWRGLVKVGLVAPFSGYDSGTAYQMLAAVRTVVGRWNERGGIEGYRIELVTLDDLNDPAIAAARARELAVDQDIVAVIARLSGGGEMAVAEYQRLALPVAVIGSPLAAPDGQNAIWQMCADAADEGERAARFAIGEVHSARPAVVVATGGGYRAAASAFVAAVGYRAAQFKLPGDEEPSPGEAGDKPSAPARAVAEAGSDFVYFSGPYVSGAAFAAALARRSPASVLLGSDADTPALAHLLPLQGKGVSYVVSCQAAPTQHSPSATTDGKLDRGVEVGSHAASAQDAAGWVFEAAREAASAAPPDRANVAAAIRSPGYREGTAGRAIFDSLGRRRGAAATIRRM